MIELVDKIAAAVFSVLSRDKWSLTVNARNDRESDGVFVVAIMKSSLGRSFGAWALCHDDPSEACDVLVDGLLLRAKAI